MIKKINFINLANLFFKFAEDDLTSNNGKDIDSDIEISEEELNLLKKKYSLKGEIIGEGDFSIILHNPGNTFITKLTKHKPDALALFKLKHITENFPDNLKKHMIEIYDIDYDKDLNIYMITSEFLKPISNNPIGDLLANILFQTHFEFPSIIEDKSKHLINPNFIQTCLNINLDNIYNKNINLIKEQLVINFNQKFNRTSPKSKQQLQTILAETIVKTLIQVDKDYFLPNNILTKQKLDNEKPAFAKALTNNIFNKLKEFRLPRDIKEKQKIQDAINVTEVKNIINLLNKLDENEIKFHDLGRKNFMIRPTTNDIVISDPGAFR